MPAHVVIDLDVSRGRATAEWVALPDRETVEMPLGLDAQ
jgi:hypothetical protein